MMQCGGWITYVAALGPALVALLVFFVQLRQAKTAKEKLRLDLYQKRFGIYESTLHFVQQLGEYKPLNKADFSIIHRGFIKAMQESQFLFDRQSGIHEILSEINKDSAKVIGYRDLAAENPSSTNTPAHNLHMSSLQNNATEVLMALPKCMERLDTQIAPYLNFNKIVA